MPHSFEDDLEDDWESPIILPALSVEVYDAEVIGTILGPDGVPLHSVMEPAPFPFGFSKGS